MKKKDGKLFRILSIDGGGIRGILPGQIIVALEKKLQERTGDPNARVADFFDLIAGTSTGGILTCLYTTPNEKGRPKFTAEEAVELYLEYGSKIFDIPKMHLFRSIAGLLGAKYPPIQLEKLLTDYFGESRLSDTLTDIIITSFNIDQGDTKFFTSSDADNDRKNFLIKDVARSTSAAPTYFPPHLAKGLGANEFTGFIDGGVFANNPTMCALVEAYKMDVKLHQKFPVNARGIAGLTSSGSVLENVFVLSIGTSNHESTYPYNKAKSWGMLQWIQPIIDIMMSGVSETVAYQVEQLFRLLRLQQVEGELTNLINTPNASEERVQALKSILELAHDARSYHKNAEAVAHIYPKPQYIRINPNVEPADGRMDNAKPKNLQKLKIAGEKAAKENELWLDLAAEMLTL